MAGETVLIPKDRYERLLKTAELYANMNKERTREDLTKKHLDASEASDNVSQSEPAKLNSSDIDGAVLDSDKEPGVLPEKKKVKFESVDVKQTLPPGIPLEVVKRRVNKIKKVMKNKSNNRNIAVKSSKDWIAW